MSFLSLQPKEEKEEGESPLDGKIKAPLGGGGGGGSVIVLLHTMVKLNLWEGQIF